MADKALRSKGAIVPTPTPSSGNTSSGETNTWSKGTSSTTDTGGNVIEKETAPTVAQPVRILDSTLVNDNVSETGTIVDAPAGNAESRIAALMAELEMRNAELEVARKEMAAASSKLEIARIQSEQSASGAVIPGTIDASRVLGWVTQHSIQKPVINRDTGPPPIHVAPRELSREREYANDAANNRVPYAPLMHRHVPDLPPFDGNISEWIAFRAEFEDTAQSFSNVNNVSRIRRALRGEARNAVKAIMYTVSNPYEIMDALEKYFGNPEEIVLSEIHNVKRMPRLAEDNSNIISFAGQVANVVATIKSLRQDQYLYAPELTNKIVGKLNLIVRYEWGKYRSAQPGTPDLVAMATFLSDISSAARRTHGRSHRPRPVNTVHYESEDREAYHRPRPSRRNETRPRYESDSSSDSDESLPRPVAQVSHRNDKKPAQKPRAPPPAPTVQRNKCLVCSGEHEVGSCAEFKKSSVAERWELAKTLKLCYRCLSANHKRPIKCKYVPCGVNQCEAGHHKLMHGLMAAASATPARASVGSVNHVSKANTFLKIVPVELSGPLGTVNTHALLDEGSSLTLLERGTADMIAPRAKSEPLAIQGVGGNVTDDLESCKIKVSIRGFCSRNLETMSAYTIAHLNLASQEVSRDTIDKCEHLREIADELCFEMATPTILIGQDNWHLIVSRKILSGKESLPVASLTNLGWVLHGQYSAPRRPIAIVNHVRPVTPENEILDLMKQHFSIETLGVESRVPKADPDQRALNILDSTCEQIPNESRYRAGLLWRTDDEILPDNKNHALRRLYSLESKLDRDANFKTEYTAHVDNLLEKGYAEKVNAPAPTDSDRVWYLPHFATTHPQKNKMRLVFDAAAKAYGKSLNDALLAGPDLLASLFGVLLRFREGKIAVVADVREMFLQVDVLERDRDALRFLWRGGDRTNPPQEYRMKRLIFGAASSPTTALYVKNKNAIRYSKEFPKAAEKTIRNSYMDDMLIALDENEPEAKRIVNEVYQLNLKASFELRGFASNNPNVISDVTASNDDASTIGKSEIERTLGLKWNHKRDSLGFNVNLRNTPTDVLNGSVLPTKRQVTSSAMSIFDPIGYISPISVLGKALMQDVWRTGIGWDDEIRPECKASWLSYIENIQQLRDLEIPRYVPANDRKGDLHVFCDSSEKIYATAIYFVSKDDSGKSTSALIAAKARVAPLKILSVPRLELQSCVLGTRLAKSVMKETDYQINNSYYWSDSRTTLAWIKSDPRTFKSFVAHRLAEIEDSTTPADWHWVPSALNVADDATKGVPARFDSQHRWFHGPEFIRLEREYWPKEKPLEAPLAPTGEERTAKPICVVNSALSKFDYLPDVNRFSKFTRLIRASACVLVAAEVFKANLLSRNSEKEMNVSHTKIAELLLIKRSQQTSFTEESKLLEAGRALPKKSSLHKTAVKIDKNGIIVLDSRIDRGSASTPVLHAKEAFTKLLIQHFHEIFNHGNHATVINELKQRYFIIGLRGCIRYICNKCHWCRSHKGATLKVPVGDLPAERLQSHQPPFTATAVDLFGPMNITIGRRHEKRWGVLYTCLTTRAVHLELAASLSAASMILSLRRMMARRGTPTVIYSDNATNFVGAERELQEAKQTLSDELKDFASARSIIWKKIPPGNPAAGGAWERMVGLIKSSLKTTLKEKAPHEEVLHTLVLEAEHIVNSRPLTPVNPDADQEALTPNHFLLGRSNAMSPFGTFQDEKLSLNSWKQAQKLADTFWKRWISEYRHTLSPRTNAKKSHDLETGDVVIIADNTMPRGTWPKGIVAKTYPGPDGHVRVAEIRTRAGLVRRPASRLIVICSTNDGADARGEDCRK